jgi:hypothetical protein
MLVTANSDDSWLFHDPNLSQLYALRDQAKNHSFLVYNSSNNKPVAIVPFYIYFFKWEKIYRIDKTYAKSYEHSGPAIIRQTNEKTRREIIQYIGREIEIICSKNKVNFCTLGSAPLSKRGLNSLYGHTNPWHEFRNDWKNIPQAFYYLDLSAPVEVLKANLETRTRTIINKFESNSEFKIRKADVNCLNDIYYLFLETYQRTGLPLHPKEEFEWLLNYEHANYYIAYNETKPVCVINVGVYENTGWYWSSHTSIDKMNSQIATYLLWYAILELKKRGVVHLDMGKQPFFPANSKEDSIAKFKRSFGGILRYIYEINLTKYNKVQQLLKFTMDRL